MTLEQKAEIMRLASVWATKRVRLYAVSKRVDHFGTETIEGTANAAIKARRELDAFLDNLVKPRSNL